MKVESLKQRLEPITLAITLETEEEARAMYAVFAKSENAHLFNNNADEITDTLGIKYFVDGNNVISRGITARKYYRTK